MLCAGLTTYSALRKSGALPGQWVVISGAGGGLGTVATSLAARGMGFRVIGIDMPAKKEAALESGAEHFIDATAFDDDGIKNEVMKLTGYGASAVVVVSDCLIYSTFLFTYLMLVWSFCFVGVVGCICFAERDSYKQWRRGSVVVE